MERQGDYIVCDVCGKACRGSLGYRRHLYNHMGRGGLKLKERLNGYWTNKQNPNITLYIDRVFKAGHVTGFQYEKTDDGTIHSQYRATHEQLKNHYKKTGV